MRTSDVPPNKVTEEVAKIWLEGLTQWDKCEEALNVEYWKRIQENVQYYSRKAYEAKDKRDADSRGEA